MLEQKIADGRRDRAVESLGWNIEKYVLPFFGETRDVRTLRRPDLEAFKRDLRDKLGGAVSINNALTGIRQILKYACHVEEKIDAVPAVANVPVSPESKGRALLPEEVEALISSVDPRAKEAREWLVFIANTGLRKSEALAVRWDWIDWQARCIRIPAEFRKGGKAQRAATPINDVVFPLLEERRKRKRQPSKGRVWFQQKHDAARNSAAARAKLGRVRNHDLRHTLGSLQYAAGASAPEVRDLLGHSTMAMVNRYAHSYDNRLREVSNRVQLGGVPGSVPGESATTGGNSSNSAQTGSDGKPGKSRK
jgi:integrase